MSNVALGTDGKLHYATDFQDSYNGGYFCPNPACGAGMALKNIGSDEKKYHKTRPYFSVSRGEPHVEGCPYANTCISNESLKAAGFHADDFFAGLQAGYTGVSGQSNPTAPTSEPKGRHNTLTTLSKLYHYCLQHKDEDALPDGTKVYEIFQEDRNKQIPNRNRHTAKLVKLRFLNCNTKDFDLETYCFKLWCMFPHTEKTKPPGIYYTLGFREDSVPLMRYFCRILTPLKQTYGEVFILVGGEWRGNHCYIASKRQIFILQPNQK